MNEISPIILVFAMFFTSIALVIAAVVIWGAGELKRARLVSAVAQLNEIVKLTNEALKTGSKDLQNAVNGRIDEWDRKFSKELGVELTRMAAA
jgi:hypothetical protein